LVLSWCTTAAAFAAPKADLWEVWLPHEPESAAVVDHSAWQRFLDQHLVADPDGINRVNYALEPTARSELTAYLAGLQQIDPRTLNRQEQLAYWINLYNAMTVEVVLRNPQKGSILRMGKGLFSIGPWNDPVLRVAGYEVTLNDVEHRILRPIWRDHRIHYAVNCASLGCPNLNPAAFTAANAEALLAESEADYIGHPRGVDFSDRGRLQLSSIFKWYRTDFSPDTRGLLEYLANQHPAFAERLRGYDGRIDYRYDWDLNRADPG
jgi:hypothetical protein